jgi:hypothetical protein
VNLQNPRSVQAVDSFVAGPEITAAIGSRVTLGFITISESRHPQRRARRSLNAHRRGLRSGVVWREGDWILLRSVYRARVRWGFMHRMIEAAPGSLVVYLPPGSPGASMGRDADGRYLERWVRGDPPVRHAWERSHVLKLLWPHEAHTLELFWDESWEFAGWYVNLQTPLTSTAFGFDTTDLALDITVDPDGTWAWKDEDDFAEAIALGAITDSQAGEVRAEGERVIASLPELLPTGWENWRPDPAWQLPELPAGWDVVEP